jgi:hypothetical protein
MSGPRGRIRRAGVGTAAALGGIGVIFVLGLGVGALLVPPIVDRLLPLATASPAAGTSPSPSASAAQVIVMNGVAVPADADCAGCHRSRDGVMSPVTIPTLAHPLKGWTKCASCHSDATLVPIARGHERFTQDQCLACHGEQGQGTALSRPHHVYAGQECTSCHDGSTAPLPQAMAPRTACWLCHHEVAGASAFPSLAPPTATPAPTLPASGSPNASANP